MTKTNYSSQIFVQGIFRFYEAKGVLPEDPEDFSVRKCSTYRENLFSTGIQHLAVHSFRKLFFASDSKEAGAGKERSIFTIRYPPVVPVLLLTADILW